MLTLTLTLALMPMPMLMPGWQFRRGSGYRWPMFWPRGIVVVLALCVACGGDEKKKPKGDEPGPATTTPTTATGEPVVDERTGLIQADGFGVVVANCTTCHSGRLVAQNRGTRRDWDARLRWMQKNHNLWELPAETRDQILDYLATNYGVDDDEARHGRRAPLPDYLLPPTRAELANQPDTPAP